MCRLWLELDAIKLSIRSFQRVLVGINNLRIHFIFREFDWGSKVYSPPIQMESWAKCLQGCFYFSIPEKIIYSLNFLFDKFWNSINLTYYHSLDQRIWFTFIFLPLKIVGLVPHLDFLLIPSLILSKLEIWSIKIELSKLSSRISMENCDRSIFPGWSILFLYVPVHKAWSFRSLSSSRLIHFHIVWKLLASC